MITAPRPHVAKNRLLKLAELLESLKPKQFDYSTFGDERECGTVACALGWAATMRSSPVKFCVPGNEFEMPFFDKKTLQEAYPADFAYEFFGAHDDEYLALFLGQSLPEAGIDRVDHMMTATRAQVAKRIRKFVAWKYT